MDPSPLYQEPYTHCLCSHVLTAPAPLTPADGASKWVQAAALAQRVQAGPGPAAGISTRRDHGMQEQRLQVPRFSLASQLTFSTIPPWPTNAHHATNACHVPHETHGGQHTS